MNETAQAILGLSFLSVSFCAVVGYHHTNLREQRGKDIETLTNSVLTYVPATLPFSDNGYISGVLTLQEVQCWEKPEIRRERNNNYICTATFFELPTVYASLEGYAPIILGGEFNIDNLIAACSDEIESDTYKICDEHDSEILSMLSIAQRLQKDWESSPCEITGPHNPPAVYIKGVPELGELSRISLDYVDSFGARTFGGRKACPQDGRQLLLWNNIRIQ